LRANIRGTGKQNAVFYIVVADVKALYPSLCRDTFQPV